jgi:glycerol uptake facilitator-like aquaporin
MLIFNRTGDADFNPGVTYLKYLTYKDEKKRLVAYYMMSYFITQILGAISGFFIIFLFKNGFVAKLAINSEFSQANAFFVEIVSSCILYLVVLIQDDKENNLGEREIMRYFFTISGVAAGIAIGGNISGAGMNPAIAIGSNLVMFMVTGNLAELKYLWIYILGPFIASHIISSFYNNVYKNEKFYIVKEASEFN